MASLAHLAPEERIGLVIAAAAHAALLGVLVLQGATRHPFPRPERINVSLASEVSLKSTAPDPSLQPAAAIAPRLAPTPEQPPELQSHLTPPRPTPVQTSAPTTRPDKRSETRPTPTPTPRATQRSAAQQSKPPKEAAASRLGSNFLQGLSDADGDKGSPAEQAGPVVQAAIAQAIIRQLKPNWNPPPGVDVDKLVTTLRFHLNPDGSLAGDPEVLRTTGITPSNSAQVRRHQEQAIRAVRLAAPFHLPEQYYSAWSVVTSNFDNRLAQ